MLGLDAAFLDRIRHALENPALLNVLTSIAKYVLGVLSSNELASIHGDYSESRVHVLSLREDEGIVASTHDEVVENQSIAAWLPLILQVIGTIRDLRKWFGKSEVRSTSWRDASDEAALQKIMEWGLSKSPADHGLNR